MRRLGVREDRILLVQSNVANTYERVGRRDDALRIRRETYSRTLKLNGEEDEHTLRAANNYADSLANLECFKEAKSLLRKMMPVARRVLGEGHRLTLRMKKIYARALYNDDDATLDDLRKAVTTLEDAGRTARRVLGGAHPLTVEIERGLQKSRAVLRARETQSSSARA